MSTFSAFRLVSMKSKSRVSPIKGSVFIFVDDIYVAFEAHDPIFELSREIEAEFMEAVDGPDAATTCACCEKAANKMKNCQFCGTVNCG